MAYRSDLLTNAKVLNVSNLKILLVIVGIILLSKQLGFTSQLRVGRTNSFPARRFLAAFGGLIERGLLGSTQGLLHHLLHLFIIQ